MAGDGAVDGTVNCSKREGGRLLRTAVSTGMGRRRGKPGPAHAARPPESGRCGGGVLPFLPGRDCIGRFRACAAAPREVVVILQTGQGTRSGAGSRQALLQALPEDVLGQVDADEHHLALALLALGPLRPQVAAHELVHALEDDLALGALHVQHALVAQHAGAVDVDDGTQEVFQFGRVEGTVGAVDEALHVVVMVMVVAMACVLVRGMAAVLAVLVVMVVVVVPVAMSMAVVVLFLQEVGVDVELGVQVEAAQVQNLGDRHFAEMHRLDRSARVHVLEAVDQRVGLLAGNEIGLGQEDLVREAHLAACLLAVVQLLGGMLGVHQRDDGVDEVGLGDLFVHEEGLGHRAGIGQAGGFDHDAVELQEPLAALGGQQLERLAQVLADRAADAAVAHLHDLFLGIRHQDVVVDVLLAEFVLDDGDLLAVRLGQHALEEGGLARAQEAREDGGGNEGHGRQTLSEGGGCRHGTPSQKFSEAVNTSGFRAPKPAFSPVGTAGNALH